MSFRTMQFQQCNFGKHKHTNCEDANTFKYFAALKFAKYEKSTKSVKQLETAFINTRYAIKNLPSTTSY